VDWKPRWPPLQYYFKWLWFLVIVMVFNATFNNISIFVVVSFIDGEKPSNNYSSTFLIHFFSSFRDKIISHWHPYILSESCESVIVNSSESVKNLLKLVQKMVIIFFLQKEQ
jgi:hypothetical protein